MSARLLKDPATASSRIFVGHLQTDDVTKLELEEHFTKYGNVIASIINRGFGFVQFEDEHAAQNAIKNEDGAMFKGRRIDVRPAKKDNQSNNSGNAGNPSMKQMGGPNNQFSSSIPFGNASETFGGGKGNFTSGGGTNFTMNQDYGGDGGTFGGRDQKDLNAQTKGGGNSHFDDGIQLGGNNDQFNGKPNSNSNNNNNNNNDHFNNPMQPRSQFNSGNLNRGNDQYAAVGQNRGGANSQFGGNTQMGNQNRPGGNQNRNPNNAGNNNQSQNSGTVGGAQGAGGVGGPPHRTRGSRGGRNRNKNNQNNPNNMNSFRERSPINRNNRVEDKGSRDWEHKQGDRLRGNTFPRPDSFGDGASVRFDEPFKPSATRDTSTTFGNTSGTSDYLAAEKNDCEIIVVNKALTKYAEDIELRLKQIGLLVDLLFPNEDVPLGRVLGNIASRGCLYAVVVTPINHEHHSLTLNILHGLPQEHRNMPVEDAINLISRDFANYKAGGSRSIPLNTPLANERHPDAIQVLLNILADNHQLTVLQYDRVIKYLEMRREEQVQVELGDAKDLPVAPPINDPKQAELQTRILNILNNSKTSASATSEPSPVPPPTSAPAPVPPATWGTASSTATTSSITSSTTGVSPSPLLNDPTVQKALDSLLQGNLLKSIGDQQPAPGGAPPLFAAFSNIGRF